MSEKPITVEGLGKRYELGGGEGISSYGQLADVFSRRMRRGGGREKHEFWAIRNISFEVEQGEKYAVVGHNGAGKSTLLKVLSRVVNPTEGRAHLRGRVGALIEVGTGFHPELTGRDNIFLNGALLGMHRKEIASKFDEIVEFSDIGGRFIDTPVKRYSSGMMLRLAFSVSAHLEAEILIVDEVLSVGDLAFQEKCLGRMKDASSEGRTVIFVSHNLAAVQGLCTRGMLLSGGEMVAEGPTTEVIQEYVRRVRSTAGTDLSERTDRIGTGELRFQSIHLECDGEIVDAPISGQDLDLVLRYEGQGKPLKNVNFGIAILTHLDVVMIMLSSEAHGSYFKTLPARGEVRVRIPRMPLPTGQYLVNLWSDVAGAPVDWVTGACELTVTQGDYYGSGKEIPASHVSVLVDHEWMVRAIDETDGDPELGSGLESAIGTPGAADVGGPAG
jgi:lipopolysaccharide transport system ATP-binding protein